MFDIMQTVDKRTHRCGYILDWILHRHDDKILRTTRVSHQLTSDHFTIVCNLDLFVPSPTTNVQLQKKTFVNRQLYINARYKTMSSLHSDVYSRTTLDSVLRSLLDKHAPMNNCKVSDKKCAPWYNNISDTL